MPATFVEGVTLAFDVIKCGVCGVRFAMEHSYNEKRLANHKIGFWCPNGHELYYLGQSESDRLRDELKWAREDAERHRKSAESARRSTSVVRGHLTRVKRRVSHGVCPCCNRSFENLRRHMNTKHPDYPATVEK